MAIQFDIEPIITALRAQIVTTWTDVAAKHVEETGLNAVAADAVSLATPYAIIEVEDPIEIIAMASSIHSYTTNVNFTIYYITKSVKANATAKTIRGKLRDLAVALKGSKLPTTTVSGTPPNTISTTVNNVTMTWITGMLPRGGELWNELAPGHTLQAGALQIRCQMIEVA